MTGEFTTHIWQSTLFALAIALLTLAFRGNRAQVRYGLWLSASLKFFIPFALLMSLGSKLGTHVPDAPRFAATPVVSWAIDQIDQPLLSQTPSAPARVHRVPSVLTGIWFCGFAAIALIRFRSWLRIRAVLRASTDRGIPATVSIRMSPGLLEPGIVGVFRPVLLLPEGIVERLTPSELETVLAHELCHVRRRDNLFASIHMIAEAVFWFHPMIWWAGARMVEEREGACDEEVLSLGNQPEVYAGAILSVCKLYNESPLACVSGVTGAGIRRRIEAIMTNRAARGLNHAKKLLLAGAAAVALAGPVLIGLGLGVGNIPAIHAQSLVPVPPVSATPPAPAAPPVPPTPPVPPAPPRPEFDVVSVKRCMPGDELNGPPGGRGGGGGGGGRGPRLSPGRLRVQCLAVSTPIHLAYIETPRDPLLNRSSGPLDRAWMKGGPEWAYSDWYTVDAETNDPVARETSTGLRGEAGRVMGQMLQRVLEDRFQLKIHRGTEEVPMYSLTVAKGGLKMKPMEPRGCIPRDPGAGVRTSEMFPPGKTPLCINWTHTNGPDWAIDGAGQSLDHLAAALSSTIGRHVFDKTGVGDLFTYHLAFAHEEATPGDFPPEFITSMFPPSDVPSGPSIFAVLDRLGLKLEPVKGPRQFVVIDRVERPSEN